VAPSKLEEFKVALGGFPATELGVVTGDLFELDGMDWGSVEDWKERYDRTIGTIMASQIEAE
jgi:phosphoribosylformylglycinamidine synthase